MQLARCFRAVVAPTLHAMRWTPPDDGNTDSGEGMTRDDIGELLPSSMSALAQQRVAVYAHLRAARVLQTSHVFSTSCQKEFRQGQIPDVATITQQQPWKSAPSMRIFFSDAKISEHMSRI